jgi:ParB/RepB/Spo0J family partition protein
LAGLKNGAGYELVVGERRFRASQLAGLTKIPAIVKKQLHDQTKLEVALIENIQRRELNPIEEAQAYDRLIKTFNLTQDQVAKKVGKSRPAITNTLRLLNLPAEIQRAVIEGKISEGHARAILGLTDTERQLQMYRTILKQGLNENSSREAALNTFLGTALLAQEMKNESFETLCKAVTSKKGTTLAGLRSMKKLKVQEAMSKSLTQSKKRAVEISKSLRQSSK